MAESTSSTKQALTELLTWANKKNCNGLPDYRKLKKRLYIYECPEGKNGTGCFRLLGCGLSTTSSGVTVNMTELPSGTDCDEDGIPVKQSVPSSLEYDDFSTEELFMDFETYDYLEAIAQNGEPVTLVEKIYDDAASIRTFGYSGFISNIAPVLPGRNEDAFSMISLTVKVNSLQKFTDDVAPVCS